LFFTAAYNYGRQRTYNFFNDPDTYAERFTWLDSNLPRHRISAAGSYELPLGKGRRLLPSANRLADSVLGGWSASAIVMISSGSFLRFGPAVVSGNPILRNPTRDRWFDTAVFSPLPSYTPRTNPWQYEGLTGPRNWNLDTILSKSFHLTERLRLDFRMEAYNLTNSFIATNPVTTITSGTFGKSVNQANNGRELQYCLRLTF